MVYESKKERLTKALLSFSVNQNYITPFMRERIILKYSINYYCSKKLVAGVMEDLIEAGYFIEVNKLPAEKEDQPVKSVEVEDKDMEVVSGLLSATVEEKKKEKEEG